MTEEERKPCIRRVEDRIKKVEGDLDDIKTNHLPHIYQTLGELTGTSKTMQKWVIGTFATVLATAICSIILRLSGVW